MVTPTPTDLHTDGARTPLDADATAPRFSWSFPPDGPDRQAAYRLLVAADPERLEGGDAVWDSGVVESAASTNVAYDGPELETGRRYHWRVWVRDGAGRSAWSDPAWFETALDPADWTASWVAGPTGDPAPLLRREVTLDAEPERARLSVSGLGSHVVAVNAERVSDPLDPALTDYEERVPYVTYDVTDRLRAGENALAVELGRGRYALTTENVWKWEETPWQGDRPVLRCQLTVELASGEQITVKTDGTWRAAAGPTRSDSVYAGERYDARAEHDGWRDPGFDASDWDAAEVVAGPDGEMCPQTAPPVRVTRSVSPASVTELDDGVVFDFGEMLAGWTELSVEAPAGTEVTIRHGERLHDDGTVDVEQNHVDAEIQTDTYVCAGEGEERWEARFSYKGFRYAEVRGADPVVVSLTAKVAHSAVDRAESAFDAGNELLAQIHENSRRAILNNYHGVPTDTPTYEKNGWTGDAQLTAEAALYSFDAGRFFGKWLGDFADAQRADGEVPPIVPTSDWGYSDGPKEGGILSPNPGWDCAYVFLPWWLYRYRGDERPLREHYEGMKGVVASLLTWSDGYVLEEGLGDWLAPGPTPTETRPRPPEGPGVTSTAYLARMVEVVVAAAELLGRERDRERFATLAESVRDALNDAFLDGEAGVYRTGEAEEYRQTSNVVPLAFDFVPDDAEAAVVDRLVADVRERDAHLNTGILGTKHLLPVLTDHGHADLAYEVATQTTYPSWGNWVENGATALYEAWELSARSRDHHMFGAIDEWFYRDLAGVRPADPGFETVAVSPVVPEGLDSVRATVDTVRGPVSVAWADEEAFTLDLTVPGNTSAHVALPVDGTVSVNGEPPADAGASQKEREGFVVGAGEWSFRVD
jgi:alpha-L-rhamnosidase